MTKDCKTDGCPRSRAMVRGDLVDTRLGTLLAPYCSTCRQRIRGSRQGAESAGLVWDEVCYESLRPGYAPPGVPPVSPPPAEEPARDTATTPPPADADRVEVATGGVFKVDHASATIAPKCSCLDWDGVIQPSTAVCVCGVCNGVRPLEARAKPKGVHPEVREALFEHAMACIDVVALLGGIEKARQLAALMRGT